MRYEHKKNIIRFLVGIVSGFLLIIISPEVNVLAKTIRSYLFEYSVIVLLIMIFILLLSIQMRIREK